MKYLTGIMFELHQVCNLATEHPWCPINLRDKNVGPMMTDGDVMRVLGVAIESFGFSGAVGFHYYNEPLCDADRLFGLVRMLKARWPWLNTLLWTNGTRITEAMRESLRLFDRIIVSDYGSLDYGAVTSVCPASNIIQFQHDNRAKDWVDVPDSAPTNPCLRPLTELIVDAHGDLHTCCYDWRGLTKMGNVLANDPADCFTAWQRSRDSILTARHIGDMPEGCKHCAHRDTKLQALHAEAGVRASDYAVRLQHAEANHA